MRTHTKGPLGSRQSITEMEFQYGMLRDESRRGRACCVLWRDAKSYDARRELFVLAKEPREMDKGQLENERKKWVVEGEKSKTLLRQLHKQVDQLKESGRCQLPVYDGYKNPIQGAKLMYDFLMSVLEQVLSGCDPGSEAEQMAFAHSRTKLHVPREAMISRL
eukprot:5336834-Prymnesium_polylepis.1